MLLISLEGETRLWEINRFKCLKKQRYGIIPLNARAERFRSKGSTEVLHVVLLCRVVFAKKAQSSSRKMLLL